MKRKPLPMPKSMPKDAKVMRVSFELAGEEAKVMTVLEALMGFAMEFGVNARAQEFLDN